MQQNSYKLTVATQDGIFFYNPEDIVRMEASSNYTYIYFTNSKRILISKILKEFAAMLEPFGFIRTHRSHLVNRQYVSQIDSSGNITMNDSSVAEISRRMKSSVLKTLRN